MGLSGLKSPLFENSVREERNFQGLGSTVGGHFLSPWRPVHLRVPAPLPPPLPSTGAAYPVPVVAFPEGANNPPSCLLSSRFFTSCGPLPGEPPPPIKKQGAGGGYNLYFALSSPHTGWQKSLCLNHCLLFPFRLQLFLELGLLGGELSCPR